MHLLLALLLLVVTTGSPRAQEQPPACPFGPGDLPATTNPGGLHGSRIPIDHIVVLMQENRSFDHYFGRMPKVRAPRDAQNPDPLGGPPIRPFHQTRLCEVADLGHSWNDSHAQWNGGAMDGFTTSNVHPLDPHGTRAMGFYTRRDIPYYHKLYRTFAMSDRHFCSVLGPTWPNRHFLVTATAFGHKRNDLPLAPDEFSQRTIFEALDEAGVTWRIYAADVAFALVYAYVRDHAVSVRPIAEYHADAAAGTLPQVAFVDPMFFGEGQSDEHPPANAQVGQRFVAGVVDALLRSPLWRRSALFITYDEHGGYWDHVPPPLACIPDDIPPALSPADIPGAYDRYGFRVPLVVVSPFARKRHVSHRVTDQTSILRFIETRFDLPALTRRDANADPLLSLFDFEHPPFLTPPRLPAAVVDPARAAECGGSPSPAFLARP